MTIQNETMLRCPACASENSNQLLKEKLVTFLFPVPEDVISDIKRESITLNICDSCGHVFQPSIDNALIELIYSEFYKHYNLDTSVEFQKIYGQRTIDFIEKNLVGMPKSGGKILDIGCGEGTFFRFFQERNYECYGFEPSDKYLIAKQKNPDAVISSDFFDAVDANIFDEEFDIIILNWVLEHVVELDKFMPILSRYCKPGTMVVFQVPDLTYYLENDLFLFYVHEHIHYFTLRSITELLTRSGFEIRATEYGDCPALLVGAAYTGAPATTSVAGNVGAAGNQVIDFMRRGSELGKSVGHRMQPYDKIYLYGAGTATFWLGEYWLDESEKNKVVLIDDNQYYAGKMAPSFNSPVKSVREVGNADSSVFFIGTSPVYRATIIEKIKEHVQGKFDICYIDDGELKILTADSWQ